MMHSNMNVSIKIIEEFYFTNSSIRPAIDGSLLSLHT